VIVVVGSVAFRPATRGGGDVVGLAGEVAIAASRAGATVELLAKVGEDGAGEEILLALARGAVGHLAILRDPARPTALVPVATEPSSDNDSGTVDELLADLANGGPAPRGDRPATSPGLPLEPADLALGLRYLRDYAVVVAVEPLAEGAPAAVAQAASFADARLVVVDVPGAPLADAYPGAMVLEAPADDPDGAFAVLVGRFAAALDRGEAAPDALRGAVAEGGWEPAGA
jgi:hypothetical protein